MEICARERTPFPFRIRIVENFDWSLVKRVLKQAQIDPNEWERLN